MDASEAVKALGQFLDVLDQAGLMVLARLAPWFAAILLTWFAIWYVRRRIRAFKRSLLNTPVAAVGSAAQAGMNAASLATTAARNTATQVGAVVLPAVQNAGRAVVDGAKTGATFTSAAIESATPHVQAAASAATGVARSGANQVAATAAKAAPAAIDVAGAALGVAMTGAKAVGILAQVKTDELLEQARAAQKRRKEQASLEKP